MVGIRLTPADQGQAVSVVQDSIRLRTPTASAQTVSASAAAGAAAGVLVNNVGTPFQVSSAMVTGHSYMAAQGVGNSNRNRDVSSRILSMFGVEPYRTLNIAVSGAALRCAEISGAALTLQSLDPGALSNRRLTPHIGMAVNWWGTNDAVVGEADGNLDAFESGYKALIARQIAAGVYDYNHSSVASGGAWSTTLYSSVDPPYGSGLGMSYASTVGRTKTITLPTDWDLGVDGAWVDMIFVTAYGDSGCVVTPNVDGVAQTAVTLTPAYLTGEHGLDVVRLWCPAGTTTFGFTITTCTAGAVRFDCWSIEATDPPWIACLEMTMPVAPAFVWAGIDQDRCDLFNERIDNAVAFFDLDEVERITGLNDALGADERHYSTDGLHVSDEGALTVAQHLSTWLQAKLAQGSIERRQLAAWWYDETEPVSVDQLEVVTGNGSPLELVDGFNRDDEETLSTSGWTERSGAWGVLNHQIAVRHNRFGFPDFEDDFERADGAVGNGWTATAGTWLIEDGMVKLSASATGFLTSPHPLTSGDGWIQWTSGADDENTGGVFFRYVDANNYWKAVRSESFGTWFLQPVVAGVAGSSTLIYFGAAGADVDHAIHLSGTSMKFFVDGVLVLSHTSSTHENGTGCGLFHSTAGGDYRWSAWEQGDTLMTEFPAELNVVTRDFGSTTGAFGFTVGDERANYNGVVFRYADGENYLKLFESSSFGVWALQKVIAGTESDVVVPLVGSLAIGTQVVVAMLSATTFRIYFDGVESAAGLITISDAPVGTHYGFCSSPNAACPLPIFDQLLAGESVAIVEAGQWYRDLEDGKMYGPFVDGAPEGSYVWLPTDHTASGLAEVVYDLVAAIVTQGSGITITKNDTNNTITFQVP